MGMKPISHTKPVTVEINNIDHLILFLTRMLNSRHDQ